MGKDMHGEIGVLADGRPRDRPDQQMDLTDYLPENWENESEEYQRGFLEAVVTMMAKGKILSDNEVN